MHSRWVGILIVISLVGSAGCSFFSSASDPRQPAHTTEYTVSPGDTLSGIANRFNSTVNELVTLNRLSDPDQLEVGQVLRVPEGTDEANSARAMLGFSRRTDGSRRIELGSAARFIGTLRWPLKGSTTITSRFGKRWFSFHEGIDLPAPEGREILAAHSGRIAYSGSGLNGYGKTLVIDGGDLITVYAHNSRNRVERGAAVERGQHIADVGETGRASATHLHFETRIKDRDGKLVAVDPLTFFPSR